MTDSKYQGSADLSGAIVSLLCAIHCAVTPLIFISKPILDSTIQPYDGQLSWGILDWFFLILSLGAVWYSAKQTLHQNLGYLLWIFWIAFAVGLLLEMSSFGEKKWLMYFGSISLAVIHIINYRYCKNCEKEKCHSDC